MYKNGEWVDTFFCFMFGKILEAPTYHLSDNTSFCLSEHSIFNLQRHILSSMILFLLFFRMSSISHHFSHTCSELTLGLSYCFLLLSSLFPIHLNGISACMRVRAGEDKIKLCFGMWEVRCVWGHNLTKNNLIILLVRMSRLICDWECM